MFVSSKVSSLVYLVLNWGYKKWWLVMVVYKEKVIIFVLSLKFCKIYNYDFCMLNKMLKNIVSWNLKGFKCYIN